MSGRGEHYSMNLLVNLRGKNFVADSDGGNEQSGLFLLYVSNSHKKTRRSGFFKNISKSD
jgi:hypothetical protein